MDNQTGKNKNQSFAQKNKNNLIVVGIVIVLLVIYFSTRGSTEKGMGEQNGSNQTTEQSSSTSDNSESEAAKAEMEKKPESSDKMAQDAMKEKPKDAMAKDAPAARSGNLNLSGGTLAKSDNEARGNYMLTTTDHGTFYIRTSRDFSGLVGKTVTLTAEGTATSFTLIDIKAQDGSPTSMTDTTAKGGESETPPAGMTAAPTASEFTFSGTLAKSDNAKGDYVISSGKTMVYLKTSKDYSSLVGSDVTLMATGDAKSFTGAKVQKK
jgi:hypothetical protein